MGWWGLGGVSFASPSSVDQKCCGLAGTAWTDMAAVLPGQRHGLSLATSARRPLPCLARSAPRPQPCHVSIAPVALPCQVSATAAGKCVCLARRQAT
eukprot:248884-Chlamydomonas_euryale.AAC.1